MEIRYCPKCKKKMDKKFAGEGTKGEIPCSFICFNILCEFWGIERINPEYFFNE